MAKGDFLKHDEVTRQPIHKFLTAVAHDIDKQKLEASLRKKR